YLPARHGLIVNLITADELALGNHDANLLLLRDKSLTLKRYLFGDIPARSDGSSASESERCQEQGKVAMSCGEGNELHGRDIAWVKLW
ncbi:MAG: hypothetical protein VW339_14925, partial [Quisquiliibacterium sp.]